MDLEDYGKYFSVFILKYLESIRLTLRVVNMLYIACSFFFIIFKAQCRRIVCFSFVALLTENLCEVLSHQLGYCSTQIIPSENSKLLLCCQTQVCLTIDNGVEQL